MSLTQLIFEKQWLHALLLAALLAGVVLVVGDERVSGGKEGSNDG